MKPNPILLACRTTAAIGAFTATFMLGAGTAKWPAGWAFLAMLFTFAGALTVWLYRRNPGLLTERLRTRADNQAPRDRVLFPLLRLLILLWFLLMPLDAERFHWSHVPVPLRIAGAAALLASFALFFLTFRENAYLSPLVRLQAERGQTVVSTGPYRFVRHPMYAALACLLTGSPLMVGSGYGALAALAAIAVLAARSLLEERLLHEGLPGYAEYMGRVKYRLVPLLW